MFLEARDDKQNVLIECLEAVVECRGHVVNLNGKYFCFPINIYQNNFCLKKSLHFFQINCINILEQYFQKVTIELI